MKNIIYTNKIIVITCLLVGANGACFSQPAENFVIEKKQDAIYGNGFRTEVRSSPIQGFWGFFGMLNEGISEEIPYFNVQRKIISGAKNATWIQLVFRRYNLGENSKLTIRSLQDSSTQVFTQASLTRYKGSTALFNGSEVELVLSIEPLERNIFITIDEVISGIVNQSQDKNMEQASSKTKQAVDLLDYHKESVCGRSDTRAPDNDIRIGRIMPIGCTGFVLKNNIFLSAGHCSKNATQIQFNVPRSNSVGFTQNPPVSDQFPIEIVNKNEPIGSSSYGQDWMIFKVLENSFNRLPECTRKKGFEAAEFSRSKVKIIGYGISSFPPGEAGSYNSKSQTLQKSIGTALGISKDRKYISYEGDTEKGSSGSPVIVMDNNGNDTSEIIGIHTDGPCPGNIGTYINDPDLYKAIGKLQKEN